MREPRKWITAIRDIRFPGGFTSGGTTSPTGHVILDGRLINAGVHDDRDIDIHIGPDELETVLNIIQGAISARDHARAMGSINWATIGQEGQS